MSRASRGCFFSPLPLSPPHTSYSTLLSRLPIQSYTTDIAVKIMTSLPASPSTFSTSSVPESDAPRFLVGSKITPGYGGINQALTEGKGWSDEDVLAYAKTIGDNHPMFAESMEEMDPAMVEAMQAIKFDGKDYKQLAIQAKNHGNDLFKWGKKNPAQYSNCIPSYNEAETYALSIPIMGSKKKKTVQEMEEKRGQEKESGKGEKKEEGEEQVVVEEEEEEEEDESKCLSKEDKALLISQIYANRAMAHMMLKNYRSCKQDCDRALVHLPSNVKAHYRKAGAYHALGHYAEAINACTAGLVYCPPSPSPSSLAEGCGKNAPTATSSSSPPSLPPSAEDEGRTFLLALREEGVGLLKTQLQKESDRIAAREGRKAERRKRLKEAWTISWERGVKVREPCWNEGGQGGGEARRQIEALPRRAEEGKAVWPLLLLYPEYLTSDFIEAVEEEEMLALALAEVLPEDEEGEGGAAPWDRRRDYRCSQVEIYFQAMREGGKEGEVLASEEEYLTSVERFYGLCGVGGDDYMREEAREEREEELAKRNVWKDRGEYWVNVHVACSLMDVLKHRDCVVPATCPTLHVFVRGSQAHQAFMKETEGRIRDLLPKGLAF